MKLLTRTKRGYIDLMADTFDDIEDERKRGANGVAVLLIVTVIVMHAAGAIGAFGAALGIWYLATNISLIGALISAAVAGAAWVAFKFIWGMTDPDNG